jgi:hypothetical protein
MSEAVLGAGGGVHTNHGYAHVRCQVVTGYGRSSSRIASSALSTSGSLPVITSL